MGFFDDIEKSLDLPPAQKEEVLRELRSHYADAKEALLTSGMPQTEAAAMAEREMGNSREVAEVIATAHNTASWRSALIAAVPFVVAVPMSVFGYPASRLSGVELGLLSTGLSVWSVVCVTAVTRALVRGRRPIWLATWLASAFVSVPRLATTVWLAYTGGYGERGIPLIMGLTILSSGAILAGIWSVPRWRVPAIVSLAISLAAFSVIARYTGSESTFYEATLYQATLLLGLAAYSLLSVLFALAVFAEHRYGSTAQAPLFLIAWSTLAAYIRSWPDHGGTVAYLITFPLLGVVAVLFARVPKWRHKMMIMSAGVFLTILCYASQYGVFGIGLAAFSSAWWWRQSMLLVATCIAAPIVYEHYRRMRHTYVQQTPTATT